MVVVFDVDYGQKIEKVFAPPDHEPLTDEEKRRICCLALPDANSGHNGDVQYSFRCRCSSMPLYSSSPLESSYLYGEVFFRQIRNPKLARGYFQKSIVIVSQHPYSGFFRRCARVVGPLYFEFGDEVLDAVCRSIDEWPAHAPGVSADLPIAGTILPFRVPAIGSGWNVAPSTLVASDDIEGPFDDVPLFTTFGSLSVSLWHIWELALTGEPMLFLAQNPDCSSRAVLAAVSLISPITYCGDFRPYFSIYDPDFDATSKIHTSRKGVDLPSAIIGVTNPYFMKALEFWPNVVSLGGTLGGYATKVAAAAAATR